MATWSIGLYVSGTDDEGHGTLVGLEYSQYKGSSKYGPFVPIFTQANITCVCFNRDDKSSTLNHLDFTEMHRLELRFGVIILPLYLQAINL